MHKIIVEKKKLEQLCDIQLIKPKYIYIKIYIGVLYNWSNGRLSKITTINQKNCSAKTIK